MQTAIEFKDDAWHITSARSNTTVTADQVVADLDFVRKGYGRGTVVISYGVPQEQVDKLHPTQLRGFGVAGGMRRLPPPAPGTRRYRLMQGGAIEPYRND